MDVDLLELIRQERRRRGWSMRAAAAQAGVSNTTWSRMESGAVPITAAMSRNIATAFDWPDDWEQRPETLLHPVTTVDAEELLERIRAELAEHERRIEQMLERLTGGKSEDDEPDARGQRQDSAGADGAHAPRAVADTD